MNLIGNPTTPISELAALHGIQTSFEGTDGRRHPADEDVLLAILKSLGTTVSSVAEAAAAILEEERGRARRHLEPIVVHRVGQPTSTTVMLPNQIHPRDVWCTIELEDGRVLRRRLIDGLVGMAAGSALNGAPRNRYRFLLEGAGGALITPGYHRLFVEWPGSHSSALLIAAPRCPVAPRTWGVFLPLHALRTDEDWGVGSYPDMALLGQWIGGIGGSMVGALPLYPAFLDTPADPSPYLPVSRLAYNELFVDPTSLPELEVAPVARHLLASDEFRRELAFAHQSKLVDYEAVLRLRRQVLAPMADALFAGTSDRRDALCAFADERPELVAYARFRANADRLGRRSGAEMRAHNDEQVDEPTIGYHLYAQWVAAQQLTATAASTPLYADLPIGVHPDGFDPLWARECFALGAHGGSPPDLFFSGGQDWSFPPIHPERIRHHEYRYFIDTVRRAVAHATYLRVDHVMGLGRLYWIPEGFDAQHGAYVSYRAEELHAIVALESHRSGTVVVGEDLGTVPSEVRTRMAEDRILRSFVLQFESTPGRPLPDPPADVLASWGTHDLPRFGSYLWGHDIDEREREGYVPAPEAAAERVERARWRRSLLQVVGVPEETADVTTMALQATLAHLARSDADLVLIDLEELWGEREPQNRPGTGTEAGNWCRRSAYTFEEARHMLELTDFLDEFDRLRHPPARTPSRIGVPQ